MAMRIVWRTGGVPTSGWPDETTTGTSGALTAVPGSATSGTGWTWDAGDNAVEITGEGATVSNLDISGLIIVTADNVTISNCRATSDELAVVWLVSVDGVVIEDCEFFGTGDINSVGQNVIWIDGGSGCEVRRCDLSLGENGIMVSGTNAVIEDNYIHDLIPENLEGAEPHTDGIQLFINIAGGASISGNNVIVPTTWATSALIIGENVNITVDGNRFRGGYHVFRPWMDDSNVYTNNRIGDLSGAGGAALVSSSGGTGTPTWSGNVNDDTDETLPAP
jgi:hypothetical protein